MKLRLDFHDIGWWYWLVSWGLIVSGMAGWKPGFYAVIILSAIQVVHYAILESSLKSFPVQVRIGFLFFVLAAFWPPLSFLYWIPAFGLLARCLVNYCLLARVISLLPWNCREPLTWSLIRRTLFTPPIEGNMIQNRPQA